MKQNRLNFIAHVVRKTDISCKYTPKRRIGILYVIMFFISLSQNVIKRKRIYEVYLSSYANACAPGKSMDS